MSQRERAIDLLRSQRDMLEARILGDLLDFGEAEYLAALQAATEQRDKWAVDNPDAYLQRQRDRFALKSLAAGAGDRKGGPD